MGVVGRANETADEEGPVDMATMLRRAVADEIERQRLEKLERRDDTVDDLSDEDH